MPGIAYDGIDNDERKNTANPSEIDCIFYVMRRMKTMSAVRIFCSP